MINEMLTLKEASEKAKLTIPHIRQLLREEKIKGIKIGKEWRISTFELNKYLGIETDTKIIEKELYIKDLENKIKNYEIKLAAAKDLINTLDGLIIL